MIRRSDWLEKMWSTIEQHQSKPFAWGDNDCCLFSAKVVDAMCDSTFAEKLKEKYHDQDSAIKYIVEEGGIEAAVSNYLGKSKTGRAQRGDVVMFDGSLGDTLGICVGNTIAAVSESGVIYMPRSVTICYWTI
jgi:hypothetical protein